MSNIFKSLTKRRLLSVIAISLFIHLFIGIFYGGRVIFEKFVPPQPELVAPPIPQGTEPRKKEYKVKMEKSQKQSAAPLPVPIVADIPSNLSLENIDLNVSTPRRDQRVRGAGAGEGVGKGFGDGFGAGNSLGIEFSEFGYSQMMEGTLTGTLYDLKREPDGSPVGDWKRVENESFDAIERYASQRIIRKFIGSWNTSFLDRNFYQAEKKLYGSYFIISGRDAESVPAAFGVGGEVQPRMVIVAYQGQFVSPESGRFRFYGKGDDLLIVRVNGRIVFDGSYRPEFYTNYRQNSAAQEDDRGEVLFGLFNFAGHGEGDHGNWFTLNSGEVNDIEILIGEIPGGSFGAWLTLEKRDGDGPKVFTTKPLSDQDIEFLRGTHPDIHRFL